MVKKRKPVNSKLHVIYEDNHLLVVRKPAGIATMGVGNEEHSMVDVAAKYLKEKYSKPGNVFVGVVSRLDKRVSGLLVLARTSKCASRLSDQIRRRRVQKRYLAWTSGAFDEAQNEWLECRDFIRKNENRQRMELAQPDAQDAQEAVLKMKFLAGNQQEALFEIDLITGRKHQIRLQLAHRGHPIVGDKKYGSERNFKDGIGLHCCMLEFEHPTQRNPMKFCDLPQTWPNRILGWLPKEWEN